MAQHQNPYGLQSRTDEYGNPIRQTDESGQFMDPLRRTGELRDAAGMSYETQQQQHKEGLGQGMFDRDRPHTQSAGEQGGIHEKKGMMEKIKEKLPGGHQ